MPNAFLIRLNMTQPFFLRTGPDGRRQVSWRVWVLIFVLPALMIGAALLLAFESHSFVNGAQRTMGEVVRVYSWDSNNPWDGEHTAYSPVFRYTFAPGDITEASLGMKSANWNFPIGSRHEILFDPSQKGNVGLDSFEYLWAVPAIVGAIGLILLLPALVATAFVLRWLRRGTPAGVAASERSPRTS